MADIQASDGARGGIVDLGWLDDRRVAEARAKERLQQGNGQTHADRKGHRTQELGPGCFAPGDQGPEPRQEQEHEA